MSIVSLVALCVMLLTACAPATTSNSSQPNTDTTSSSEEEKHILNDSREVTDNGAQIKLWNRNGKTYYLFTFVKAEDTAFNDAKIERHSIIANGTKGGYDQTEDTSDFSNLCGMAMFIGGENMAKIMKTEYYVDAECSLFNNAAVVVYRDRMKVGFDNAVYEIK